MAKTTVATARALVQKKNYAARVCSLSGPHQKNDKQRKPPPLRQSAATAAMSPRQQLRAALWNKSAQGEERERTDKQSTGTLKPRR